ncbi:hypothetical protein SAMN05443669_1005112 [Flavobacterium xanthum]|uniref:Uncharacterized protein n=1 Tax=Flavobacterium xanthum TaxID=69322 RepID=A0A1M6ZPR1_9FLAO|nr:hypothetical protein SAMN05443669_1005112 [Flavobacterium xanthum]
MIIDFYFKIKNELKPKPSESLIKSAAETSSFVKLYNFQKYQIFKVFSKRNKKVIGIQLYSHVQTLVKQNATATVYVLNLTTPLYSPF